MIMTVTPTKQTGIVVPAIARKSIKSSHDGEV